MPTRVRVVPLARWVATPTTLRTCRCSSRDRDPEDLAVQEARAEMFSFRSFANV